MKIRSFAKLGGAVALSALVLAGCGSKSTQSQKKELTWVQQSNMTTMDISKVTDQIGAQTLNNSNEAYCGWPNIIRWFPGSLKIIRFQRMAKPGRLTCGTLNGVTGHQ